MPTTLDDFAPFDAGIGANRTEGWWRDYAPLFAADGVEWGVENQFEVFADGSGTRETRVRSGRCRIKGHWGRSTTQKTLVHDSNVSGNPRIDRVILRVKATENLVEIDIKKGTPASSPAAPALTYGPNDFELSLAQVTIANGATSLAATVVADERKFAAPGGVWKFGVRCERSTGFAVANNTDVAVSIGDESHNDLPNKRLHDTTANQDRFVAPWTGRYRCAAQIEWDANAAGYRSLRIEDDGGKVWAKSRMGGLSEGGNGPIQFAASGDMRLTAGDYVRVLLRQTSGGSLNVLGAGTSAETWIEFEYLGP